MSNKNHLNYIILSDGQKCYLFEREHKDVPFEAYSKSKCLIIGNSVIEILEKSRNHNRKPWKVPIDFSENLGKSESKSLGSPKSISLKIRIPAVWEIEKVAYEVVFNV